MRLPSFYPILDTATAERRGIDVVAAAGQVLDAGVQILQFRHKGFLSREIFEQTQQMAAMCRQAGAMFVVNDRADIALLAGAGLHIGQTDLAPVDARRSIGSSSILGYSTHSELQLLDAVNEPVDYIAFGPMFGTSSKENPDPVVGIEELRRLRPITDRPIVAIGGITRSNALAVLGAGADSVAVIGDLFPEDGNVRGRAAEWLRILA